MKKVHGIDQRVADACFLWSSGRHESALLLALISVAAAARLKYPSLTDRERFEQYFRDSSPLKIRVEYRGKLQPIEHIFYKYLRCNLVHEAELPLDIHFIVGDEPGLMSVRAGGAPDYIFKIGCGWFHHLIRFFPKNKGRTRQLT